MIVPLTGNVTYPITLDPSVWIFDDRKVVLEEAFSTNTVKEDEADELEKAAYRWNQEVYQQKIKPPVNKSIHRFEKDKILKNSYVMPITDFLKHAEVKEGAKQVTLVTNDKDVELPLDRLEESYLLFALNGKPLKDDGPVHLYFKDGSNKDQPIKGIKKIVIN